MSQTENTLSRQPLAAGKKAYYRQRQKNRIFEQIITAFVVAAEATGITKRDIAYVLNKEPSQITRWLAGPGNLTLDTISDLLLALDEELEVRRSPLSNRPTPNFSHPLVTSHTGGQDPWMQLTISDDLVSESKSDYETKTNSLEFERT